MNKKRPKNIHPRMAKAIFSSVNIPVLPAEIRNSFLRPDTLRFYTPKSLNENSDDEEQEIRELEKAKANYRKLRIQKVLKKNRNSIGKIRFTVLWNNNEEETLYSEYLHDHPDWYLIEEFEHKIAQKLKNSTVNHSDLNGGFNTN